MSEPGKTTLLDWWLRYVRLEWRVFPLRPRTKIPLIPKEEGGRGCIDATIDEEIIRRWYAMCPAANIGIATGYQFFVLDVDVKNNGDESFDYLAQQHGAFPDTIQQVTGGGGKQLLFASPSDFVVRNSNNELAPGIDIRGEHGYIVAPPSIHPETGRRYFWDGLKPIEEQKILPAPAWLLDWLRRKSSGQPVNGQPQKTATPIAAKLSSGNRHNTLLSIAGSMRRRGLEAAEIFVVLQKVNKDRCNPPYGEEHLQKMAESVMKYPPDTRFNVFRAAAPDQPGPAEPAVTDETGKASPVDVESAIDAAIGEKDLVAVMRLAPAVAQVRPQFRAVIKAKLKIGFGREWPESLMKEFDRAITDALGEPESDGQGQFSSRLPPGGEAGGSTGVPFEGPNLLPFPLTDAGNGERMALLFGHDVRYCTEMKKWLVWDGKRWAVDEVNVMRHKGKEMARLLYAQALHEPNQAQAKLIEKHARASEGYSAISNALGQAASEKGIAISALQLDQHPYLLNCPNGVVDLRTGNLLPHAQEFFITKLCPVSYDPAAECPQFLDFVEWAMGGGPPNPDKELSDRTMRLVGFLQRALGYGLTGDVTQKVVFVFYGLGGNNGKTTLLTLFRNLLGRDYASLLLIETVMAGKASDSIARADMADLRGARFVQTTEVGKEDKLNEQRLKYLTQGMGWIKSKRLYENPIEFEATHKLYMDCNFRPKVKVSDEGTWRRLKLVPFEVTVEEDKKDLHLSDKLNSEMQGILAWAVRGCQAILLNGLGEPPEVKDAGTDWRDNDDPLKEFLDDCCELDEGQFCTIPDMMGAYQHHCKESGERFPLGRSAFNELMAAKGFTQDRQLSKETGKTTRFWMGVGINSETRKQLAASRPHLPQYQD